MAQEDPEGVARRALMRRGLGNAQPFWRSAVATQAARLEAAQDARATLLETIRRLSDEAAGQDVDWAEEIGVWHPVHAVGRFDAELRLDAHFLFVAVNHVREYADILKRDPEARHALAEFDRTWGHPATDFRDLLEHLAENLHPSALRTRHPWVVDDEDTGSIVIDDDDPRGPLVYSLGGERVELKAFARAAIALSAVTDDSWHRLIAKASQAANAQKPPAAAGGQEQNPDVNAEDQRRPPS
jgi:hypothetical protein